MFSYFPDKNIAIKHCYRDYIISAVTFISITLALTYDGYAPLAHQKILAMIAWILLMAMLWGECQLIRVQVMIAIIFAMLGENFASLYMEGYIYRFKNIPAYIPAGHGIAYLTAVALGRSGFFQRHARHIAFFVIITGSLWAIISISSLTTRNDAIGAVLFCIFLGCLFKGRSPMVYLGAFFITSWLEIVGTYAGTWSWAEIDPVSRLSQGNPPSGVAAWYCLVDAVAMTFARPVLSYLSRFYHAFIMP